MITRTICGAMLAAMLAFAGCGRKDEANGTAVTPAAPTVDTIPIVKQAERSSHFDAVNEHLEIGGTVYAYVDIDGDVLKIAAQLEEMMGQVAATQPVAARFLKQDYPALVTVLGLDGIKAVGLSSVPDSTGFFRNKVFVYVPGERRGLLESLGGKPAPFARLNLAPADTDLYFESEVDLPAVYATVRKIVDISAGEEASGKMEQALKDAGHNAALSLLALIQEWKGRMAFVMKLDPAATIEFPSPQHFKMPAVSFLVSIDGIAPALRDAIAKSPLFAARKEGALEIFEFKQPLPLRGIKPVIVIDGSTLLIATSPGFLEECRSTTTPRLADTEEFKAALAHVGAEGNGLEYISPAFFRRLADLETLNPNLPAEPKRTLAMVMRQLPSTDRPLVAVRSNLPDGLLIDAYWNRSLKRDMVAMAVYNPVTIGLFAAMAIPAFNKVRETSQQKAVLNNLRQLSSAAEQYFMETGRNTATYDDLVGPGKYIPALTPVAGENYHSLRFAPGARLKVRLASGREVTFAP